MTVASTLVPYIAQITGQPPATVKGYARRFGETGYWPVANGANVPDLGSRHVVLMLLALAADVHAKDAASTANAYYSLADPNGNKLGDVIVNMIDSFKRGASEAALALRSRIEIDSTLLRACLSAECEDGQSEVLYGVQHSQWQDTRVRRSLTISGKVLFDLACGLHFNRWPDDDRPIQKDTSH